MLTLAVKLQNGSTAHTATRLACMPTPIRTKSPLDRLLAVFSDVRAGEATSVLLLALNVFLLLTSYYLLKTIRESLILTESGAFIKSYASAGQALLLLLVIPAYGYLGSKVNRVRLITFMTLFFVANIAIFYLVGRAGTEIGVAFFLWVGIFNVFIVAQFWSFANDLYTEEEGKRLFPVIGVGASLGAWIGAMLASQAFKVFDPYTIMLFAGAGLFVTAPLIWMVDTREGRRAVDRQKPEADKPLGREGGFKLVFSQRYLFLIAILMLLLNISNSNGEYLFGALASEHAKQMIASGQAGGVSEKQLVGQIYGDLFSWVNLLGFLFQAFLVSRIFRYFAVRGALFILPCIALGSYSLIALYPVLQFVRIGKILENSTDYSIQSTTRQGLFLPTSREAKYKAKAVIDTFFQRFGDVVSFGCVYLVTKVLLLGVRQFALINLVVIIAWLAVAAAIFREHKKLTHDDTASLPKAA